jgi:hypothetical protein
MSMARPELEPLLKMFWIVPEFVRLGPLPVDPVQVTVGVDVLEESVALVPTAPVSVLLRFLEAVSVVLLGTLNDAAQAPEAVLRRSTGISNDTRRIFATTQFTGMLTPTQFW